MQRFPAVLSFVIVASLGLVRHATAQEPAAAPEPELVGFVLEITGGSEVGSVPPGDSRWQLGNRERRWRQVPGAWPGSTNTVGYTWEEARRTPVVGPSGVLRVGAGVGLRIDPSLRLAFGYAGQVAFGVEQPEESDATVVLQRHGLGVSLRSDAFAMTLVLAYVRATFVGAAPGDLDGVALEIDPGFVADGFTMRFPIGVDLWSEDGAMFPTFHAGLAFGGSLL